MTISTLILVLLLALAFLGAALVLVAVVHGDGRVGPGRAPQPPRSHYPDIFDTTLRHLR